MPRVFALQRRTAVATAIALTLLLAGCGRLLRYATLLRFNVHLQDGRLLRTSTRLTLRNKRSPRG